MASHRKVRVLFLCTGNSCRSQMAEADVDITGQSSKLVSTLADVDFDLVVTVCGHADENCPAFLGKSRVVHVGFDDPPKLAKTAASEEEALSHYRRVRDEIRTFVEKDLLTKLSP